MDFREIVGIVWMSPPTSWDYIEFHGSRVETLEPFDLLKDAAEQEIRFIGRYTKASLVSTQDTIDKVQELLDECRNLGKIRAMYDEYKLYLSHDMIEDYYNFDEVMQTQCIKFYNGMEKIKINPVTREVNRYELICPATRDVDYW